MSPRVQEAPTPRAAPTLALPQCPSSQEAALPSRTAGTRQTYISPVEEVWNHTPVASPRPRQTPPPQTEEATAAPQSASKSPQEERHASQRPPGSVAGAYI